jgi:predicted nucleic acid-binding protein
MPYAAARRQSMRVIDTDVLVRLITRDEPDESAEPERRALP